MYFIQNYLIHISIAFLASLALIWQIVDKYPALRFLKSAKTSRTVIGHVVLSLLICIPSGVLSGNFFHQNDREEIKKDFEVFRRAFTAKVYQTATEIWALDGYAPTQVRWPLLIERSKFEDWRLEYIELLKRVKMHFSPEVVLYLAEASEVIDSPHVATYRFVENDAGNSLLSAEHSFTHKDVTILTALFSKASELMDKDIRILYVPWSTRPTIDYRYVNEKGNTLDFYDFWLQCALQSQNQLKNNQNDQFKQLLAGIGFYFVGRHEKAVPYLETVIMHSKAGTLRIKKDDLFLTVCILTH